MYRDWRELTKALISANQRGNIKNAKISKAKLRRKETVIYKQWVENEILRNPKAFDSYSKNQGIGAVRDQFFQWLESPEGSRAKEHVQVPDPTETSEKLDGKVVLVPIAVPGCGTYLCISLSHL